MRSGSTTHIPELCRLPAVEVAQEVRAKRASPVEVMRSFLDHAASCEPHLKVFAHLDAERAMAQARAAEAQLMHGDSTATLHGVPVTVKDYVAVAGMPTRIGSRLTSAAPATQDAPLVQRLQLAGAIVVGKTTMTEYGWSAVSHSPLTGTTHNPWRHGFSAGASSAGAAAAAAAGIGALHQGSDGAGSIRLPAHFCGVYGLKPSFGRVPNAPLSANDFVSHAGPITRTVADAALMLEVMAGPHPADFTSLEQPPAPYHEQLHAPLAGKRFAFSADLCHARVDPEIAQGVRAAAETFVRALGAELSDVAPAWGPRGPELGRRLWSAHLSQLSAQLPAHRALMDPGLVALVEAGASLPLADYQALRAQKYAYVAEIHAFFEDWDFLLTPTASVASFPVDRQAPEHWGEPASDWMRWAEFSYPFNMAWNPAASVPCGFTREGMPFGLQIVGRRFDDLGVLQVSAAFEAVLPWAQHWPPPLPASSLTAPRSAP